MYYQNKQSHVNYQRSIISITRNMRLICLPLVLRIQYFDFKSIINILIYDDICNVGNHVRMFTNFYTLKADYI